MSSKRKRRSPSPEPRTPMAQRLEHVRTRRGIPTLRDFHRELTAGSATREPFQVSYAAVRNYHYDREAPVSYLARVADVFMVRLPHLATGDGYLTVEEQEAAERAAKDERRQSDPIDAALAEAFPDYEHLGPHARAVLWHTWGGLWQFNTEPRRMQATAAARWMGEILSAPLKTLQVETSALKQSQVEGFVILLCQAVEQLSPPEHRSQSRNFGTETPTINVPEETVFVPRGKGS